jgi:hypothetical protein
MPLPEQPPRLGTELPAGWGQKGRRFKSGRPDYRKPALEAGFRHPRAEDRRTGAVEPAVPWYQARAPLI